MYITAVYPNDPSREVDSRKQYEQLWTLAKTLTRFDMAIEDWHPSGPTPESILLNRAFDHDGPTVAAVAIADQINPPDQEISSASISIGEEGRGGCLFHSSLSWDGLFPSTFDADIQATALLDSSDKAIALIDSILSIWHPFALTLQPFQYRNKQVFKDRRGMGWMLFLPVAIEPNQVPEAAHVLPRTTDDGRAGTLIVSVDEVFDIANPDHVRIANDIEIRLVDQDLYPTNMQIAAMARR